MSLDRPIARPISAALARPMTGRAEEEGSLLDQYPGAAAAYSLRKLRSGYTGPCVRVRRSSDNAEQDFTASEITDGTLTSFCGSGDGFVRAWYGQSQNLVDATETKEADQPQIVNQGSVITDNLGDPAIEFDGSSTGLSTPSGAVEIFGNSDYFVAVYFTAQNPDSNQGSLFSYDDGDASKWVYMRRRNTPRMIDYSHDDGATKSNSLFETEYNTNIHSAFLQHIEGTEFRAYFDNTQKGTFADTGSANDNNPFNIGYFPAGPNYHDGLIKAAVAYPNAGTEQRRDALQNEFAQ